MSTFDSTKTSLGKIIDRIGEGKIQLPDFQRGWVWDDDHIRSLLVSIARSFPIGSLMLLEVGGTVRFQIRPVEGVEPIPSPENAEQLILDGQQRLTSLYQVLKMTKPVKTKDGQKNQIERYYYFDIDKMLFSSNGIDDAIVAVDADKKLRKNFGRDIVLDLSTSEKEYEAFHFPCNQIMNSDKWEEGLMVYNKDKFPQYMEFRKKILNAFREYDVPIIELKKETSKEAVCLVFEKVNTGGVPLSVFELMTATYSADGFNLRTDWYGDYLTGKKGREHLLKQQPLLSEIEPTDFLQGLSILHSYEKKKSDLALGKSGKEVTAVSAKREHVLELPLSAYRQWADKLTQGFLQVDRFLRMEGFHHPKFLPYRSQLVPLATVMVHLGDRWLEPVIREKLARWFWCGVFGELYGSAIETRIALDHQDLLSWILDSNASEPTSVIAAGFQASRLDTLRTRTSAAYRGLYVLLQRQGCRDFFWKAKITELDRDDCKIDIHHIFPKDWCETNKISPRIYNSIINKTAISYKANRMIGGKAPSEYLELLRNHSQVQITLQEQNDILNSHLIDPNLLRTDDFTRFYESRKQLLIKIIEAAMGKAIIVGGVTALPENDLNEDEE